MSSPSKPPRRQRAGSIQKALEHIETDPRHHLAGAFVPQTPIGTSSPTHNGFRGSKHHKRPASPGFSDLESHGLWNDLITMRWMRVPVSSLKMLLIPVVLWVNWQIAAPNHWNPWSPFLFISNRLPDSTPDDPRYGKSYFDILFLAYYVIFFSFVRQSVTLYVLAPLARYLGIKKQAKVERFGEQGYAILYFGVFGSVGIYAMSGLPTWYYQTEHFWIGYPHWRMTGLIKTYYLLQSSYWLQQLLVLVLRLEKPRKDFTKLVIHHLVTLWLIGWSYLVNLTMIGNAVFITMDVSDVFLALAKSFNYLKMEKTAAVAFSFFVGVWTYLRHWLNIRILWSVWTQFHLIGPDAMKWEPENGIWLAPWMQYQIFAPILLLQFVNLFWYFLIWRILLRALFSSNLADERSDDEDEGPENEQAEDKED